MFGENIMLGALTAPNYIYKEDIFGDSSCIGLYTMDYDFSDSSGNDNDMGVFGSPDHGVSGGLNLGARFDGYNTSARAYPVSDLQGLTSISISFWFKWEDAASVSSYEHMVNIGDANNAGAGDYFGIAIGDDGNTYNKHLYSYMPGPDSSLNTNQVVSANVWHHVLATWSGTSFKVYYDGNTTPIQTRTVTSLSLPNSAVNRIAVGHYSYNGGHHFRGDLDHLRVFNREIQSSELATLYNETFNVLTPSTTNTHMFGCVANYNFDNSAKESLGTSQYDGTESNIEYRFGRFGQAAVFNGSNSYIYASGPVQQPTTNFSVSVWSKWDSKPSSSVGLVGNFKTGVTPQVGFGMTKLSNENVFSFWADGTANSSAARALGTTNFVTGKWYHTVGTYDGYNVKIYVNGVLEGTVAYTATPGTTDQPLVIGRWYGNYNGYYHDGQIDQVRLFSTALNSDQVTQLYNEKPETDTSNFKTVIYDGTGGTDYISNVGIDLESNGGLIWFKERNGTNHHQLYDNVRGYNYALYSNLTNTQYDYSAHSNGDLAPASVEANGFFTPTVNNNGINRSGGDYVAWVWKGGGAPVSNSNGTITSSVSANPAAGFSIVKWTGTGVDGKTIGHGLGAAPELIITKGLSNATSWVVGIGGVSGMSVNDYLTFTTYDKANSSTFYQAYSTNTFQVGVSAANEMNKSASNDYISYCFRSISGYSSIGTYSGTNSSGNTAITGLGFTPSWFMAKRLDADGPSWTIHDNRRVESNGNLGHLFADTVTVEGSTGYDVDFVSGGVTINATTTNLNASGTNNYLYMVFK